MTITFYRCHFCNVISYPKELLKAPKKGFNMPMRDWFNENELGQKIREILLMDDGFSLFDRKIVNELLENNTAQKTDLGDFIWQLVVLKSWLNKQSSLENQKNVSFGSVQKVKVAG